VIGCLALPAQPRSADGCGQRRRNARKTGQRPVALRGLSFGTLASVGRSHQRLGGIKPKRGASSRRRPMARPGAADLLDPSCAVTECITGNNPAIAHPGGVPSPRAARRILGGEPLRFQTRSAGARVSATCTLFHSRVRAATRSAGHPNVDLCPCPYRPASSAPGFSARPESRCPCVRGRARPDCQKALRRDEEPERADGPRASCGKAVHGRRRRPGASCADSLLPL